MAIEVQGTLTPDGTSTIPRATIAVECIVEARYVEPAQMYLRFVDGLEGTFTFEQLRLDMVVDVKWETVQASNGGTRIEVQTNGGECVLLDYSGDFRYLVDATFAAKIDQSIRDQQMTPAEQEEAARISMLTRDPRWYDVGDEDDLFGETDG